MLQIQAKEFNICGICKLIAKYTIQANITNQVITLEGNISEELLSELYDSITICMVQNFRSTINHSFQEKSTLSNVDESTSIESKKPEIVFTSQDIQEYDLIYDTVKRGEVYFCDFGEPYGSEQGYMRPAIIVQNNQGNIHSPTTIVLPCTAEQKKTLPVYHKFVFSNESMLDYNLTCVGIKENVVMSEQIRIVDKKRLRKFLGTMTPKFMDEMQKIIDISLQLKRTQEVDIEQKGEKLILKIGSQKENSMIALSKEISKFTCHIQLDIENGLVTVENVDVTMIDTIIELIENYYTLLEVDIQNSIKKDVFITKEINKMLVQDESVSEQKTMLETFERQYEDDLSIKKVNFENKYIEQLVNKFLRTAYWALFKMNIPEKEIGNFIWTSISEISMRYSKKDTISFSIGDIVDCNYGTHLAGEIEGGHVKAIICNISNKGLGYLVPIVKMQENIKSYSYLIVRIPNDITYNTSYYVDEVVLLEKGKYVRPERFNKVVGRTSPEFFAKVLHQLATTFDFTKKNSK